MPRTNRREEIMRAAEKLFTSRRLHEITMEDVAREAKSGKGTIYRYFKDKDDLFRQVAMSGFDELCELLEEKVPGDAPFADQLVRACREISSFFKGRRQLFRMMQSEEARISWCRGNVRHQWMEQRKRLVGAVAHIMTRGVEDGQIRSDIPADVLAGFLLGMLRAQARGMAEAPKESQREELLVDLFCHGARPR